jgi:response regulator RpfG family c-di-GMP phosphodiesterase
MLERILLVDDEAPLLEGLKRTLRGKFEVITAQGPVQGLGQLERGGPFSVVVADMRMPGMMGTELLKKASELDPLAVRIMLTGLSDQTTAVEAINKGHIFRFLSKPCPPEDFIRALEDACSQHRLMTAEKELTEMTLRGSLKVLSELISLLRPAAFGRADRVRQLSLRLVEGLSLAQPWRLEVAAALCQLGTLTLPADLLEKAYRGLKLDEAEQDAWAKHPKAAHDLLVNIPRMSEVARIIFLQGKGYDGSGYPESQGEKGEALPLEARILRLALDLEAQMVTGADISSAIANLERRKEKYDPKLLVRVAEALRGAGKTVIKTILVNELIEGMLMEKELRTVNGLLLVAAGQEVTESLIEALQNYQKTGRIEDKLTVRAVV